MNYIYKGNIPYDDYNNRTDDVLPTRTNATYLTNRVVNGRQNYRRILLTMILSTCVLEQGKLSTNDVKICRFVLNHLYNNKRLVMTNSKIAKCLGYGYATVGRELSRLNKANMITRHTGYITLNNKLRKRSHRIVIDFLPRHVSKK